MMSSEIWVVVADSAHARIFSAETPLGPISEQADLIHGEGRLRRQDLVSDDNGRAFDSKGNGRHGMEPKTDVKTQEQCNFALEINHYLEQALNDRAFKRLYVVAPPAMMGCLRSNLSKQLQGVVVGSQDKNLTQLKPEDIRSHLPEKLWMING